MVNEKKTAMVRLDEDLKNRLKAYAAERGISLQDALDSAVRLFLERKAGRS